VVVIARGLSWAMAHAPFLWPVLRTPTRKFWDRAASMWDTGRAADVAGRTAPLRKAIESIDPPPARILELGTGTGSGALVVAEHFPAADITAADLSTEMVEEARRKLTDDLRERIHFEQADAAKLPYPDGSFDMVFQLNLPLYAAEVARVVRPGGTVVIAHTLGTRTPYYTPDGVLKSKFARLGIVETARGEAGIGTYFIARRPA
jgi:SAM-dependent methyltransferase